MKKIWELKQSINPDTLEMYIYGYIEGDYYDWWNDRMIESETSADHFKQELAKYPDVKFINLYINSSGGEVMEAMAIRNQLKRHSAYVTGYVDGFACSAASFILTGCDKVVMYSNTMQMLHDMWTRAIGNYRQLEKASIDLKQISIGNRQAYVEKSNGKLTEEKVAEILVNESWLTAKECLEYGLCDEIVEETKDLTKAKEIMQKMNHTLEQQISYTKALVALSREMIETPKEKIDPQVPTPEPKPEPKQNNLKNFLAGIKTC